MNILVRWSFIQKFAFEKLQHHILLFVIVWCKNAVERCTSNDATTTFRLLNDGTNFNDSLIMPRGLQKRAVLVQTYLKSTILCCQ